jgi:hypothetical protein
MLAASFLVLTIGQLKQPFALTTLDSNARVSTHPSEFFRSPVEEVASQADLSASTGAISDSTAPIEIGNDLADQNPLFDFEETDGPAKQVFHRRILPASPDDDN